MIWPTLSQFQPRFCSVTTSIPRYFSMRHLSTQAVRVRYGMHAFLATLPPFPNATNSIVLFFFSLNLSLPLALHGPSAPTHLASPRGAVRSVEVQDTHKHWQTDPLPFCICGSLHRTIFLSIFARSLQTCPLLKRNFIHRKETSLLFWSVLLIVCVRVCVCASVRAYLRAFMIKGHI